MGRPACSRDWHRIEDFAAPVRLRRRRPGPFDRVGLAFAGPGRHRRADHLKPLVAVAAELEMRAGRYRKRYAGAELDELLIFAELAPHAPQAGEDVPNLLDRTVSHRFRDGLRRQRKDRQTAA